jgi:hypothetical protein
MRLESVALVLAVVLLPATSAVAVPEEGSPAGRQSLVPLNVQVVFSEFDGDRKVSSLPYLIPVNAAAEGHDRSTVRMGIRVPLTGKDGQIVYMDVGTNIDCWAGAEADGRFEVGLQVERTSIYSGGSEQKPMELTADALAIAPQPIVRTYSASMALLMRDGQTVQRSIATDPLSGRVLKLDVTVNVAR